MDDWDGLHICKACGDAYTTGRLCTSCAHQEMIDRAEGWIGGDTPAAPAAATADGAGDLRQQLAAAFHPNADDWGSLFFWMTAALGQAQFGADMAARVHQLEDAGAEVELRLQEHSELFSNVLNRAMKVLPYDDDAKRKISEAWKWAYYASAIHLQIVLGSEVRAAYRAKVAAIRAEGEAYFAQKGAAQQEGEDGQS